MTDRRLEGIRQRASAPVSDYADIAAAINDRNWLLGEVDRLEDRASDLIDEYARERDEARQELAAMRQRVLEALEPDDGAATDYECVCPDAHATSHCYVDYCLRHSVYPALVARIRAAVRPIEELIEASSLGTPEARAARDSVPLEVAQRIVAAAEELGEIRSAEDVNAEARRLDAEIAAHPRGHIIEALAETMQSVDDDGGTGGPTDYYRSLAYCTVDLLPALAWDESVECDEPGCGAHRSPSPPPTGETTHA